MPYSFSHREPIRYARMGVFQQFAARLWRVFREGARFERAPATALLLGGSLLSACENQGFQFLETITQGGDEEVECAITTQAPIPTPEAAYDLKVSGVSGSLTTLSVGTTASECEVEFKLNGTSIVSTGATVSIAADDMLAGLNLIEATSGGVSVSWNIYKNSVPVCASQTPGSTGTSMSPGGSQSLTGNASDADSDTLAFNWLLNGSQATSPILNTFNAATSSLATFSPDLTLLGPNAVLMQISDGTDTVSCSWNVTVNSDCVVSSTTPTAGTSVRVAAATSTVTSFQALAPMGCLHTWKLNGQSLPGATGSATLSIASSSLDAGSNILEVTVGNGASTDTKTWTVVKNTPPSCSGQSPGSTGTTIGVGATPLALTADATDFNASDTLSFSWKRNGAAVTNPMFSVVPSGATSSIATFTPDSTTVGSNIIRADISDGYDTSSCTWTVQVVPVCSVGSSSPNGSSLKVPYAEASSQTFVATPNDPSCAVSWRINGNTINGATNPLYAIASSQLGTGTPNTVEAVMSNGYTTATRSWTVTRNTPPSCNGTPVGSTQIGVGGTQDLTAAITNTDSDPLVYTWTRNGSQINPSHFIVLTSGNSSIATFMPTSSYIGANTIVASVTDGYDSASCSWSVNVANNCAITASFPATTVYKVSAAPSTAHVFGVIPSDSSCTVSWTLNGGALPSGALASFTSGDLLTSGSATPNTLVATLTNASGSTTRTWSVIKNRSPACGTYNSPATSTAPAMNYGETATFSGTGSDPDSDPLSSFLWRFNGNSSPTLFNPVNTVGSTSTTTFNPSISQVGVSQDISLAFSDGYDAGACSWSVEVQNPNTVEILACQPTNSPASPVVVLSSGAGSSQTLTVVASNASGFSWFRNGSALGVTTATLNVSSSGLSPGVYNYRAIASDAQGNAEECDYSVKINSPPTVDLISPAAGTYKVNYGDTMVFAVSASDSNSDTLSYAWTLNGTASGTLPSGSDTTTFSPGYNTALLGTNTISVTVSDGAESVVRTWTVEVNQFSTTCNTLYNGPVSTHGGKACTLVGVPGIGNNLEAGDPLADQTLVRLRPHYLSEDDAGNLIVADGLSSVVGYFNRSSSPVTRFGRTIPGGTLSYILGNGADGITIDGVSTNSFKLNAPTGTAYDSATGSLYVADYNNHRVVKLDQDGVATTVLGATTGTWQGNTAAFNTDGNSGTYQSVSNQGHSCAYPVGLTLVNDSNSIPARRWLYVACAHTSGSSGSIKKLDIDPASANYGRVWIAVGRTVSGVVQQGNADGSVGPAGEATVYEPWGLTSDAAGNIYWVERVGLRLRMATTAGSAMTFFGSNGHLTQNQGLWTADVTTPGPLATPTASIASQTYGTGTSANKVAVFGPVSVVTSSCDYYSVQIQDATSVPMAVSSATTVTLSASGGGSGAFFSNSTCTSALAGGAVTVAAGASQAGFFYRNSAATATATITGASAGLASASVTPIQVTSPAGTATKMAIYGPTRSLRTECTRFSAQLLDNTNKVSTSAAARTIRLVHTGIGTFYTNSSCSGDPIYTMTIGAGQTTGTFYYTPIIKAAANQVVSLAGGVSNSLSPASGSQVVGVTAFRGPRGVALNQDASGNVLGFFVSNSDQHRIHYLNNTASSVTIGGTAVGGYETGVVAGTTAGGGYNGDAVGNTARVNFAYGLYTRQNGSELLVADYDNWRVRALNIGVASGYLDTVLGAGRSRSGNLGDSPIAATSMYLNGPSQLAVHNTTRKLYVSDTSSNRIRRVDLLTGEVDTIVGKTYSAANVDDNETPTNATIAAPRGLAVMSSGSDSFLLYSDFPNTTNINQPCLVRALNLTPDTGAATTGSLFGISMNPSRVYTVAGDFVKGCYQWNASSPSAPNVSGTAGVMNKLYNPDGIASDGQNLYISNYSDHCILKLNSQGNLSPVVGICGTAGASATPALGLSFQISNPTGIVVDPQYASSGNFFFIDRSQNNPSRVNYVNCRSTSVQIGATLVNGTSSVTQCQVATIWNTGSLALAPAGYAYGLAAFDSQICFSSGQPGSGTNGAHNVSCFDRTNPLSPQTLRLGAYEGGNPAYRAGGPLGLEQEGVSAFATYLNAPFGLAFDSSGNLYVSERGNSIVRMVRRWW